jgi:hypothetical protein
MATTVTAATLTSTITELITLNGQAHGNTNIHEVASQGEALSRVMSVAVTDTILLNFSTADSAGTIVGDDMKYLRITNLDDTNYVTLSFYNGAASYFKVKLAAGESHLFMNNQMAIGDTALADMTMVKCQADTVACDVEIATITS